MVPPYEMMHVSLICFFFVDFRLFILLVGLCEGAACGIGYICLVAE